MINFKRRQTHTYTRYKYKNAISSAQENPLTWEGKITMVSWHTHHTFKRHSLMNENYSHWISFYFRSTAKFIHTNTLTHTYPNMYVISTSFTLFCSPSWEYISRPWIEYILWMNFSPDFRFVFVSKYWLTYILAKSSLHSFLAPFCRHS